MPIVLPHEKAITYSLDRLKEVENALNEIENLVLVSADISGDTARHICTELNNVRDQLALKRGVQRHAKFSSGG